MDSFFAAAIAIFGTLAGSVMNHLLQNRSTSKADGFARAERLREQRLTVYGEFAKVIMEYRRAEFTRWDCAHQQLPEQRQLEARAESHRIRSSAWHSLYQVDFLSDDRRLIEVASMLLEITGDLHHAGDEEDLRVRGGLVREELRHFVEFGSAQVR